MGTLGPRDSAKGDGERADARPSGAVASDGGLTSASVALARACGDDGTTARAAAAGWLRTHWQGRFALGRSFWLHKLAALLFVITGWVLLFAFEHALSARALSASALVMTLLGVAVDIWWGRGTWIAAMRQRAGGKRFGRLAQYAVALVGLYDVVQLVQTRGDLAAYWATMLRAQPAPLVRVHRDRATVVVEGGLYDGAAAALRRALDDAPQVTTVVLASAGGHVHEGEALARLITERQLGTHVEGECSSACTLAFLAGKARTLGVGAQLGFHRMRRVIRGVASDAERTDLIYRRAQLPAAFVARVVATPPTGMWYPSPRELLEAQVVTATHEWDEAWDDLMASTRAAVETKLSDVRLTPAVITRIVECQVAEHIRWLNTTGCAYHFDEAEMSRVEHLRQQDACVSAAAGADDRERMIELPCLRAHVPNDWSIFRGVFERSFAAEIDLRKPQSADAAAIGACAAAHFGEALDRTPCKPLNMAAQSTDALFRGDEACMAAQTDARKRALSAAFTHCTSAARGRGKAPVASESGRVAEL